MLHRLTEYHCQKCGKTWSARQRRRPKQCPSCRTKHWQDYNTWKQGAPIEPSTLLQSVAVGRFILLVNAIHTNPKHYAELTKLSVQAVSQNLDKLRRLGIASEKQSKSLTGVSHPKAWEPEEKLDTEAKAYAFQRIDTMADREIDRLKNTSELRLLDLMDEKDRLRAYHLPINERNDPEKRSAIERDKQLWAREDMQKLTTSATFTEYRTLLVANVEKRRKREIMKITKAFAKDGFPNFLRRYFYVFYPDIEISLAEIIEYYLLWGDFP